MPRRNDLLKQDLVTTFCRAVQDASQVGGNLILSRLDRLIRDIDPLDDNFGVESNAKLSKLLGKPDMALDGIQTREFIQKLGEVHFYALCKSQGLELERVPEGNRETPDFRSTAEPVACFEVKTPCLAGGERTIKAVIEESFDGRVDIERQLASGHRIASAVQLIQPYGSAKYEQRITKVITVLEEKIEQNLKRGQFAHDPTYLVCSLLMLPTHGMTAEILRPTYGSHREDDYCTPVTGELWMTAFSERGMLIQSEPEFEGKPGVEGRICSTGILIDAEYVAGIIFLVYGLDGQCRPMALLRSEHDLTENIHKLVGNSWNDRQDTNGYALAGL